MKKIMLFFSQKDYKMLHGLLWGRRVFLVYLEKYFQGQFCRHFFAVLSAFPATFRKYQPFPAMPRIVFWLKKAPGRVIRPFPGAQTAVLSVLQMQQHLCNVEVDQQRGGIHNGGDQG